MNIIQITPYYPPRVGGLQNVVRMISETLASRKNKVLVFSSDLDCELEHRVPSKKDLTINYLGSFEFAHTPIIPNLFSKLMRVPKDSIMHFHISQALIHEISAIVCKIKSIPYIAQVHSDLGPSGPLGFLLPLYKKLFLKKVLKGAKKVIVLNEGYKKLVKEKYGLEKNVVIVPNGVGREFFLNKSIKQIKKANILYVGRLTVEKNVPKIIDSFSKIKNKAVLHIVGDGELRPIIEEKIRREKLSNIILYGFKGGKDLIDLYKKADIFILASDYEGQPLVLLEAMASGTPIIASDVRGIRELAKGIGILMSPPTAENFAKEIDKLIVNKKLRQKMSELGKEKARQFTWEKVVDKLEEIYREALNEHKNKSH